MADSFLKVLDLALETVIFNKFQDILFADIGYSGYSGWSGYSGNVKTDMAFMPKDVAFRYISEKRGKVEMEFMNLWRSGVSLAWDRNRSVLANRDLEIPYTSFGFSGYSGTSGYSGYSGVTGSLRAVPAKLPYEFWIWSKDKDKLNACAERYLFWLFNSPFVTLSLNGDVPLDFYLHFGEVNDESTEAVMFDRGLYFVYKFPIIVEGWIFELSTVKLIEKIFLKAYDDTVDPNGVLLWSTTILS